MADSERAAELSRNSDLDVGLHLNFTAEFTGNKKSSVLRESQERIARYLLRNKYCLLFYNPFLKKDFEYVYKRQYEEFVKLYDKVPTHIDGHHHMHLCTNMLFGSLIPLNSKVRKSFSFFPGEKKLPNRLYRLTVDGWLKRSYVCTDLFFSLTPVKEMRRLQDILELSRSYLVELMVHPQKPEEFECLMSDEYMKVLRGIKVGNFEGL